MKRLQRIAKTRVFQVFFVVFVVFALWTVHRYCLFGDRLPVVSPETTYITEPLREDGRGVDYFKAMEERLHSATMQTDDNGYRVIVRALGDLADRQPFDAISDPEKRLSDEEVAAISAQVYEKLGLDPEIEPTAPYQTPFEFLEEYFVDETNAKETDEEDEIFEIYGKLGIPWTTEDVPAMAQWLEEDAVALDVVAEAVARPDFQIPFVHVDDAIPFGGANFLAEGQAFRGLARGFATRALYRIARGDLDGAVDDVIACKRLGRHANHQGTLFWGLIGIAIEGIAESIDLGLSDEVSLTEAQLQRIIKAWEEIPPCVDSDETVLASRYAVLDLVQGYALGEYSIDAFVDTSVPYAYALAKMNHDWNIVMRRVNQHYDDSGVGSDTYVEEGWMEHREWSPLRIFLTWRHHSDQLGDYLAIRFGPHSEAFRETTHRSQCGHQLYLLSIAMLLHEQRHGTLPPPYIVDADGNLMHSWRVLMLPYIGQQEIYDKIRLNEPWDSEHNRQFHEIDVPFYACPSAVTGPGKTTYAVVVGENTAFHEDRPEPGPKHIPQILLVERRTPVCWMDPTQEFDTGALLDWNNDEKRQIGSNHPGGANFSFRSASVHFIPDTCNLDTFQKLFEGTCPLEEMP